MRLSLRFLLPLALVLAGLAYAVIPLVDTLTLKWFMRDLELRSQLIAGMMEAPLTDLLASESKAKLSVYFHRIIKDERLFALGFCDSNNPRSAEAGARSCLYGRHRSQRPSSGTSHSHPRHELG